MKMNTIKSHQINNLSKTLASFFFGSVSTISLLTTIAIPASAGLPTPAESQTTKKSEIQQCYDHYDRGNYPNAVFYCTKAIESNPQDFEAYIFRGLSYEKQDNYLQAISDYTKAIEIDPKYLDAYYNRGLAYYDLENDEQSISDLRKAVDLFQEETIMSREDKKDYIYIKRLIRKMERSLKR